MELPNRKPYRIAGYDYSQNGAYFVTICTQDRKKILSKISVGTPVPGCPYGQNVYTCTIRWNIQAVLRQGIRKEYLASLLLRPCDS